MVSNRLVTVLALALVAVGEVRVAAEQLPLEIFTTADGLPRNAVNGLMSDRRGLLWVLTPDGLAAFDGHTFTTFGQASGLPSAAIVAMIESRAGGYWVGTTDGLCRFEPETVGTRPATVVLRPPHRGPARIVGALLEDRTGTLWVGTESGLYRLATAPDGWQLKAEDLGRWERDAEPRETPEGSDPAVSVADEGPRLGVEDLLESADGSVWAATTRGLVRRCPNGTLQHLTSRDGLPSDNLAALAEDRSGSLWVGTAAGLCLLEPAPGDARWRVGRVVSMRDGLPSDRIFDLCRASGGGVWVATVGGLARIQAEGDGTAPTVAAFTPAQGLSDRFLTALAQDPAGNLWIGSESGGLMRMAREGFTTYGAADGLEDSKVHAIFEDAAGDLCLVTAIDNRYLSRFDGRRFVTVRPRLPATIRRLGWGTHQLTLQDHVGEWWVPTGEGLCRFPRAARPEELAVVAPVAVYTSRDGLNGDEVFCLFEDSRGDLWIGTIAEGQDMLTRWDRRTGRFQRFSLADGVPREAPTAFLEDRAGQLWVGFYTGGIGRFSEGRFALLTGVAGAPTSYIWDLHLDPAGRLWVATGREGLVRVDHPESPVPTFTRLTVDQGLASDQVRCVVEDRWGRLYLGTPLGVDRLDPASGQVKHFTVADGLANSELLVAFRDRHDALWFGTLQGLSRLAPEPESGGGSVPVWIRSLRVAGNNVALDSAIGQEKVEGLVLQPDQRHLEVELSGSGVGAGNEIRYQYLLEGGGDRWSAPTAGRTVTFANLAPGRYRFRARAVQADGVPSPREASVSFTVRPPFWRRWYFPPLLVLAGAATAYRAYRRRLRHLLELERLRTRIATDLHDDVGSSLGQLAILSEVAKGHLARGKSEAAQPLLDQVVETTRDLLDAMGDVVWSVNPERDRVRDLAQRVHRFASDTLTAAGRGCRFHAPPASADLALDVDTRRQLYLICKEAVNNSARHSGCSELAVELGVERGWLTVDLVDDGCGFDPDAPSLGEGLASMRRRASAIGGTLELATRPGEGTRIRVRAPLRAPARRDG